MDGSDNFATRYIVNDACIAMDKVLIYGSIFAFEGQVAVFNYKGSKNLRDIFPEPPSSEDVPSCDRFGVLGPLPGIVGSIMAMQALQVITDLAVISNHLLIFNTKSWEFAKIAF